VSGDSGLFYEPAGGESLTCDQAHRQIERLVEDNDLKEVERALLHAHLRVCPACKALLDSHRRLETRLKDAFSRLDTAPGFSDRVLARLPTLGSAEAPDWSRRGSRASLPATRKNSSISSVGVRSFRATAWLIAASVMMLAGLTVAYFVVKLREPNALPTVVGLDEAVYRVKANGREVRLDAKESLVRGEVVHSAHRPAKLQLADSSGVMSRPPIGSLTLAPESSFCAINRHTYKLISGAAYFQVEKNRPKASASETFEVDAGGQATVKVTGTAFVIDLRTTAAGGTSVPLVAVQEGTVVVEVRGAAGSTNVTAGKELLLKPGALAQDSDINSRLAQVTENPAVAVGPPPPLKSVHPPAMVTLPVQATPSLSNRAFNWNAKVKGRQPLAGKTLAEGVSMIADALDRPKELLDLAEQLRKPLFAGTTLSFSVNGEMPVKAILSWMGRDIDGAFDPGDEKQPARFTTATRKHAEGDAGSGLPPEEIRQSLEAKVEENLPLAGELSELLERLGSRCGVTIIVERGEWSDKYRALSRSADFALPGQTVIQKLDALLGALHLGCAWYDHVLYVDVPSHIEVLTTCERKSPLAPQLVGQPLNAEWVRELKSLLATLRYPPENQALSASLLPLSKLYTDAALSGKPVFAYVAEPNAEGVRYRTGLLGSAALRGVLLALSSETPPVQSAPLTQPAPREVQDMDAWLAQLRMNHVIDSRARFPAFTNKAIVFKNLLLGDALEWTTWICGFGLRLDEKGVLVLDEKTACYGPPALQVLSLNALAERYAPLAKKLSDVFKRVLPAAYPTFFAGVEFRCIGGKLVFMGDLRQVLIAQRVRSALEHALENNEFKPDNWLPPGSASVRKNLAEPFASGSPKLSGTFAGLLRNSELSSQLRCTLLVDPAAMREHAGDQIAELEVEGASIGKVLELLAQKAGMKVVLEGDIIWLRTPSGSRQQQ
jgi:hypothetical protein